MRKQSFLLISKVLLSLQGADAMSGPVQPHSYPVIASPKGVAISILTVKHVVHINNLEEEMSNV